MTSAMIFRRIHLHLFAASLVLGGLACYGHAEDAHLGRMKAERCLFLGNSITICPQPNTKSMWGLSASTPAKDYAHLLVGMIKAKTGGSLTMTPMPGDLPRWYYGNPPLALGDANVLNIADLFERNYATWENSRIQRQIDGKPDIVVLQFGENMVPGDMEKFKVALKKLVADLKTSSNPHIFMPSYILGANAGVDEIKRKICAEDPSHRVFVDLSGVSKDASNMGAYGHPNDKGMGTIADTLFKAMLTHSTASSSAQ